MKILHVTATHLNKYGGIPVVLENLVEHQNKIDNVNSIVLSVQNDVKNINSNYFYFVNNDNKIKDFIINYNPDITIFHGFYFSKYLSISKILLKNNFRYYIQPHSSFMKQGQKKGKVKKIIANKILFKNFAKNAYGNIFLNECEMKNSVFRKDYDIIIPNGISPNNSITKKVITDKIKLFFIGRIDINHKGLDILLEELKKLDDKQRDFSIDIYGVGKDKDLELLNSYISQFSNLSVQYKGPAYNGEKEKVFKEYNIMLLTSRYEGFPMTILEALSYGNPCIVTDGTNVKEMIEQNDLGWGVEYKSISTNILKAINDYRNKMEFYVNNTKDYVNNNLNWDKIAKQSIDSLVKIIENE